uniref:Innexin n=1 Tax=Ditylenchus dipsaci TaxID=166011 RepID=A0A915CM66_9BILA
MWDLALQKKLYLFDCKVRGGRLLPLDSSILHTSFVWMITAGKNNKGLGGAKGKMSSQLGAISSVNSLIGKIFTQPKGDLAARLNSRITVTILAVSAGLLLTTHFWGEPITCWLPAEFTKSWTDFANQYCYVHGTYFSHLHQPLNFNEHERQMISIDYYQWVPYVLALQAIFFYIPDLCGRFSAVSQVGFKIELF